MKINKYNIILIQTLLIVAALGGDDGKYYMPEPTLLSMSVPVSESASGIKFSEKLYFSFGDFRIDEPIAFNFKGNIINFEESTRIFELYDFIQHLLEAYRSVTTPEDMFTFSYIEDRKSVDEMISNHWSNLVEMYNSVKSFRLLAAWFSTHHDVMALMQIHLENGNNHLAVFPFRITDAGWLLRTGASLNNQFMQDLEAALYFSSQEGGVKILSPSLVPSAVLGLIDDIDTGFTTLDVTDHVVGF